VSTHCGCEDEPCSQPVKDSDFFFEMRAIQIKIAVLCILGILFSWRQGFCGSEEFRLVHGIGYPPVKASSRTQALLMARRAAVLDAYRNAARGREEDGETLPERDAYEGFSAFVRGIILADEVLLSDGGVQVTMRVARGGFSPLGAKDVDAQMMGTDRKPEVYTGPIRVSEEEWYRIIEQMVRFDGKTRKKRE
jgi:hypothetical protein